MTRRSLNVEVMFWCTLHIGVKVSNAGQAEQAVNLTSPCLFPRPVIPRGTVPGPQRHVSPSVAGFRRGC